MSNEHIQTLAGLERLLDATYHDHKQLALLIEFHSLPVVIGSNDTIRIADRMEALADRLGDFAAAAEAEYHRGVAHIERHKERCIENADADTALQDRDLALAIKDLKRAYRHFSDLERELAEEQIRRERRRKLQRDKARPKPDNPVPVAPEIERFHKRAISSALALGKAYMRGNALDKALEWFENARKLVDASAPSPLAAAAYEALGETYRLLGDSENALKQLRLAVSARRRIDDAEGIANALGALAQVYHSMGDLDAALDYYRQSLQLYQDETARYAMLGKEPQELACRYRSIAVKSNMARVYLTRSEPVTALEMALHALIAYEEFRAHEGSEEAMTIIGDIYDNIVTTRLTIGRAHSALQQWKFALDQYSEAYIIAQTRCRRGMLLPILLDVGAIHRDRGELDDAIQTFQNGLSIAEVLKDAHVRAMLHKELATTHEKADRCSEALQYYKKYVEINNEISVVQKRKAMAIARIQFDTEQKILETRQLQERNARIQNNLTEFLVNVGLSDDETEKVADRKWVYFQGLIEDICPGFLTTLTQRIPTLTPKQIQVCALLRLGLDQDQIINALGMAPRTLETHRNRIRRQLGCDPGDNLVTVLTSIGPGEAAETAQQP